MSALLTSLASIGNQYGEATDAARKEKRDIAEKAQRMDSEQAYLQLAKQAEERQRQEFEFRKRSGDLIEFKDGRLWSVSQGKFIDPQRPDPMTTLKRFIDTLPPDIRPGVESRAHTITEQLPGDPKAAISEVMRYADEVQKEQRHTQEHSQDVAESEKFRKQQAQDTRDFQQSMRADQHAFERQMVDLRLQEKAKYMTPQERAQWESIKTVEPMATRLQQFLEKNQMTGENDYVFGNRSALMQRLRARGYRFGVAQEPATQELIKDAAAISIMGAAPWVRIGRGKFTLEQIQQHLPKPTDTPANLYDKVTWLKGQVLDDAKASLAGLVPPGGGAPTSAPATDNSDPLGVLPGVKP